MCDHKLIHQAQMRPIPISFKFSLILLLVALAISSACTDANEPAVGNPISLLKQYSTFNLSLSYLSDLNTSTQTFELDDEGHAFISLRKMEAYKLKNGEAAANQSEIDFVYQVSSSGKTGYFSNTGYFKPSEDGYQKSPFGENWTDWNDGSLIAPARTMKLDPVTNQSSGLSDEEFERITDIPGLATINFGDNVSVPLDDSFKPGPSVHFDIWQNGKVEENNFFAFRLSSGARGVIRVRKDDDSTSLLITIKMAY
jgi:hypothetical protein